MMKKQLSMAVLEKENFVLEVSIISVSQECEINNKDTSFMI